MKLAELSIGDSAKVKDVNGKGALRRRMFDMGITPGTELFLRKKAPLGDPLEITIRGYELTLRAQEAESVEVERL